MLKRDIELDKQVGMVCGQKHTCGNKIKYEYENNAKAAAIRLTKQYNAEMGVYYCVFCKGFHIGNKKTEAEKLLIYQERGEILRRKLRR